MLLPPFASALRSEPPGPNAAPPNDGLPSVGELPVQEDGESLRQAFQTFFDQLVEGEISAGPDRDAPGPEVAPADLPAENEAVAEAPDDLTDADALLKIVDGVTASDRLAKPETKEVLDAGTPRREIATLSGLVVRQSPDDVAPETMDFVRPRITGGAGPETRGFVQPAITGDMTPDGASTLMQRSDGADVNGAMAAANLRLPLAPAKSEVPVIPTESPIRSEPRQSVGDVPVANNLAPIASPITLLGPRDGVRSGTSDEISVQEIPEHEERAIPARANGDTPVPRGAVAVPGQGNQSVSASVFQAGNGPEDRGATPQKTATDASSAPQIPDDPDSPVQAAPRHVAEMSRYVGDVMNLGQQLETRRPVERPNIHFAPASSAESKAVAAPLRVASATDDQTGIPALPSDGAVPVDKQPIAKPTAMIERLPISDLTPTIRQMATGFSREASELATIKHSADGPHRMTELRLSPAELGRVTISMQTTERGLQLQIIAERPETLEIVKRQIDGLHRALISDGVRLDSLDLGRGDTGRSALFGDGSNTRPQGSAAQRPGPVKEELDELEQKPLPNAPSPGHAVSGRLDIRL